MIPQAMQALLTLCALFVASASAITPCPGQCACFSAANGIRVANCTDLPDRAKATTWPQKILRIHFESDRASPIMLNNKAFKHFPRLTYLDVTGGTIHYVGNSAFDGLPELLELNLVGTGIRKLHQDTFAGNQKLAFLSLKKNPRLSVGPSFLVSESITELDLSECALKSLKSVYFRSLPNLKYLFATRNELKVLGSQFGPYGLKYVDLSHNQIEYVREDLEAYKRLKTIDLTGNPINCTCELSEVDKKLTSRGVAFGNTVKCKNTGKPLDDMAEACSDKGTMGNEPADMYQADGLLQVDSDSLQSMQRDAVESGSGEGSGDVDTSDALDEISAVENNTSAVHVGYGSEPVTVVAKPGSSSEPPESETVVVSGVTPSEPPESVTVVVSGVTPSEETPRETPEPPARETSPPPVQTTNGNGSSGADHQISNGKILAPENEPDVQAKVAEYLTSNVGIAGTVALLAVLIVAVAYLVASLRRSRSHDIGGGGGGGKEVELEDIKYVAVNAEEEDSPRHRGDDDGGSEPAGSAEDHLLADRESDDDGPDGDGGSSPAPPDRAQNGLLNSVMDAVKNNQQSAAETAPNGSPIVPTRVIVKLTETPKASKPITINNVH